MLESEVYLVARSAPARRASIKGVPLGMIQNTFWNHSIGPDQDTGRSSGPSRFRFAGDAGAALSPLRQYRSQSTGNPYDFPSPVCSETESVVPFPSPSAQGTPASALRRSPLGRSGIVLPVFILPHR